MAFDSHSSSSFPPASQKEPFIVSNVATPGINTGGYFLAVSAPLFFVPCLLNIFLPSLTLSFLGLLH